MPALPQEVQRFQAEVRLVAGSLPIDNIIPFQKKIVFEALSRLVNKTPVDLGRARGNWQVTINEPAQDYFWDNWLTDPLIEGLAELGELGLFQVVYITNNIPYIEALEGGHSQVQAPEGMLGPTISELEAMFP